MHFFGETHEAFHMPQEDSRLILILRQHLVCIVIIKETEFSEWLQDLKEFEGLSFSGF